MISESTRVKSIKDLPDYTYGYEKDRNLLEDE